MYGKGMAGLGSMNFLSLHIMEIPASSAFLLFTWAFSFPPPLLPLPLPPTSPGLLACKQTTCRLTGSRLCQSTLLQEHRLQHTCPADVFWVVLSSNIPSSWEDDMKIKELMFVKYFRLLRWKATLKLKQPEAGIPGEVLKLTLYLGFKEGNQVAKAFLWEGFCLLAKGGNIYWHILSFTGFQHQKYQCDPA